MHFKLTEIQAGIKSEMEKFASAELNDISVTESKESRIPSETWRKCGEVGLFGMVIPAEYGGAGLDPLSACVGLEAVGYGCKDAGLVFSLGVQLAAVAVPIWRYGTEEQKKSLLPDICQGQRIGCHAITEPDTGSDALSMKTSAIKTGGGYTLTGRKHFISNCAEADIAIVYAVTDKEKGAFGGITAFLIDTDVKGFCKTQGPEKMGMKTTSLGEIVMEEVMVNASSVLGGVGGGATIFNNTMDWERVLLSAIHIGTMTRLLQKAIEYARTRKQFGQIIGKFQAISHAIADMKVKLDAARLLVYRAAWALQNERMATLEASIAKLFVSESMVQSALDALRIHGAYGYTEEYEIERVLRDSIASLIYSGTSEMQKNLISKWLGL